MAKEQEKQGIMSRLLRKFKKKDEDDLTAPVPPAGEEKQEKPKSEGVIKDYHKRLRDI